MPAHPPPPPSDDEDENENEPPPTESSRQSAPPLATLSEPEDEDSAEEDSNDEKPHKNARIGDQTHRVRNPEAIHQPVVKPRVQKKKAPGKQATVSLKKQQQKDVFGLTAGQRKEPGARVKHPEVRKMIAEEPEGTWTDAELKQLKIDYLAHQEQQETRTHATNAAAARDVASLANRINDELCGVLWLWWHAWLTRGFRLQLAEKWTGCRGFAIITSSHVHDTIASHIVGSEASLKHFPEMQNMDGTTFAKERSGNPRIRMNYVGYEQIIMGEMGWELLGWPEMVPMQAPSKMGSGGAAAIVTLWERLTNGTCRWERVSDQRCKEICTKYKGVPKKGPRKTLATDKEEEEEPEEVKEDDEEEVAEPNPAPSKRKQARPEASEDDCDADSVATPWKKRNCAQTQEDEGTPVLLVKTKGKAVKAKEKVAEKGKKKKTVVP
ncbi:hypothetical protein C8R45DRAFT_921790 [Mycena sanguinolenta]|nr:hypothetical protein C8R45DRAFT_921790 [Mycena sanguinolenta]